LKLLFIYLFPLFSFWYSLPDEQKWLVDEQSVLVIHGKTNINQFECKLPSKKERDTLLIKAFTNTALKFDRGKVKIDPQVFNCGNEFIKRDFLETLKADEYPYIYINFVDIYFNDLESSADSEAEGNVKIYICGVTNSYPIDFIIERKENGKMSLIGEKELKLSEFNIKTPSKMMGLIKVSDEIKIQFNLLLSRFEN